MTTIATPVGVVEVVGDDQVVRRVVDRRAGRRLFDLAPYRLERFAGDEVFPEELIL